MRATALGLVAILALFPATELAAQTVEPDSLIPLNWPQELSQDADNGTSLATRIASGIGGAVLGAGLGFFASQVVQGDWEEGSASQPIDRSLWAVIGGSVGFTVGLRFPFTMGRGTLGRPGLPRGREHLGALEFEGMGISNAHEAVSALRPEWFRIRGPRSLVAGSDPVVVEGSGSGVTASGSTPLINEAGTIQVYVDGVNLGGIDHLYSIGVLAIRDMYFFDAGQATIRWGEGNPHGAILIIT